MCTECSEWIDARDAKIKRETTALTKDFVCEQCVKTIKEPDKEVSFLTRSCL